MLKSIGFFIWSKSTVCFLIHIPAFRCNTLCSEPRNIKYFHCNRGYFKIFRLLLIFWLFRSYKCEAVFIYPARFLKPCRYLFITDKPTRSKKDLAGNWNQKYSSKIISVNHDYPTMFLKSYRYSSRYN